MPNNTFEKSPLIIEPLPGPETLHTLHGLRESLDVKIKNIDEALRTLEQKLQGGNLLKHERTELESVFDQLETSKKELVKNTPTALPLVDQYGNPFDKQPITPVVLVDQYSNPFKNNSEESVVTPSKEPLVTSTSKEEPVMVTPAGEPAPTLSPEPAEIAPDPVVPPKTPAELLAEKIRNLEKTGETLTAEDFEFRTKHWPEVSAALLELSRKETEQSETSKNFIEMGKPSLDRLTTDYGEALFKNKSVIYKGLNQADPLVKNYLKQLSDDYHTAHFSEVQKIHESRGTIADQMTFYKEQSEKLAQEIMKRENEATKKRVALALSKTANAAGNGLLYLAVFGAKATKDVWGKGKNLVGQGIDKAQELWNAPAQKPRSLKERLMERFQIKTPPESVPEPSEAPKKSLTEKYGNLQQKMAARRETQKTMRALEDARALEKQTKETLEKILGKPLEQDTERRWNKLSEIPIVAFFNPTVTLGKQLDDYPEDARKIHDALAPIYKRDLTSNPQMELRDYVTLLVKEKTL